MEKWFPNGVSQTSACVYEKFLPVYIEIVIILKVHRGRDGPYSKSFYKVKFQYLYFQKQIHRYRQQIGGYQREGGWGRVKWIKGVKYMAKGGN